MSRHKTQNNPSVEKIVAHLCAEAHALAPRLAGLPQDRINAALTTLAGKLRQSKTAILEANARDLAAAGKQGFSAAMTDRLSLTDARIEDMASGVEAIAALEDPAGLILEETTRPNGLVIQKISVPIGLLGIIYESRPNVTIDAACLCLKSRNAVLLRGGSESFHSAGFLHQLIRESWQEHDIPPSCVAMIPTTDRAAVGAMLAADQWIDVIIPRGGKGLISRVMQESKIPVFAHLEGNCHIYVHESAPEEMVLPVILNAKMRRTGICGAAESLLLDRRLSPSLVRKLIEALIGQGCQILGDEAVQKYDERVMPATEQDWSTEYLNAKISARTVDGVEQAVEHINRYGSHHTDCILAADHEEAVAYFTRYVDSAIVMHNTSTQFADGGEFGMGAEIGIGTGKLHARGPVGLRQLTTYKYIVRGEGQTRP